MSRYRTRRRLRHRHPPVRHHPGRHPHRRVRERPSAGTFRRSLRQRCRNPVPPGASRHATVEAAAR